MKKDDYIRIRECPSDYAQKAYQAGFLIEAIQVLHGWIECQARALFMLVGAMRFSTDLADTWDCVNRMAYKDVITALLAVGQLTKDEFDDLLRINSARNSIIHQMFKDPYDKEHHGFPRADYDSVFSDAMKWAERMREKNEELE